MLAAGEPAVTQGFGYRDTSQDAPSDDLRYRMMASPTGRQLAGDGSFVFAVYDTDPTVALLSPPNGTTVMWEDAGTGDRFISTFLRATGWKSVQVAMLLICAIACRGLSWAI